MKLINIINSININNKNISYKKIQEIFQLLLLHCYQYANKELTAHSLLTKNNGIYVMFN